MKINHNDSAVIANVKLLRNEGFLNDSMERLSSGLKINHAKDNPSGMAISNKMKAQIDGLGQAGRNSSDGMSVLETADGTLQELTNILQRIRELAVQAANDTNAPEDRDAIQNEINELSKEIDRVAEASEFNTKSLLDGSLDVHSYGDHMSRRHISETVQEGFYNMEVTKAATQSEVQLNFAYTFPIPEDMAGSFDIGGSEVSVVKGMTQDDFNAAVVAACERSDVIAEQDGAGNVTGRLISVDYGRDSQITVSASPDVAGRLGIHPTVEENLNDTNIYTRGEDAEIDLKFDDPSAFKDHPNANVVQHDNKITIKDTNGFEISFKLEGIDYSKNPPTPAYVGDLSLEVTDLGPMDIQVGANAYQQIPVRIPSVSLNDLYLDKINVRTFNTSSKAIADLDEAISYINRARSQIGSFTNRLEHTVASTDATEENMTAAISRISDVDMAREMTEYTKQNVLVQAATSALSQANELPQMALQLLQ